MQTEKGSLIIDWKAVTVTSSASDASVVSCVAPANATSAASGLVMLGPSALQFTASAAHGFFEGQMVNILGATDAGYNGYVSVHVVSTTVFTYQPAGALPAVTPDVGTATAQTLKVRKALIQADIANGGTVTIGPNVTPLGRVLAAGQDYEISQPNVVTGDGRPAVYDLAKWFFKGSATSQKLNILYLPL